MKFNYRVKHNGVVYPAGTDVPVDNEPKKIQEEPKKENVQKESRTTPTPKKKK